MLIAPRLCTLETQARLGGRQRAHGVSPDNDFIVPATQSVCELVAAVMQFAAQDVVQSCAPGIMLLAGGLLQPQLQERAVLYAPKLFTQVRDESFHYETL